jgi:amino acid transporter
MNYKLITSTLITLSLLTMPELFAECHDCERSNPNSTKLLIALFETSIFFTALIFILFSLLNFIKYKQNKIKSIIKPIVYLIFAILIFVFLEFNNQPEIQHSYNDSIFSNQELLK